MLLCARHSAGYPKHQLYNIASNCDRKHFERQRFKFFAVMGKLASVHDKFVRAILGNRELAIDYFKSHLPSFVSDRLDFSTLTQLPDSYLSKRLQKTMSDIVYSCRLAGDSAGVKISQLVEHKSKPEKYVPIQLGGYLYSGYQRQIDNKETLSVIIPVLLYNGQRKWKYPAFSDLFKNLAPEWQQFLPSFDYIYVDLSSMPDEQLEALSNQFLAACFLALKHARDEKWLIDNAIDIFTRAVEEPGNLLEQFAVYFFENSVPSEAKVWEILELIPEPKRDKIMNTFEMFEKKGIEQGIEKSKESFVRNLLANTELSVSKIAELAETSDDFVVRIQSLLNVK
jgi:predicted transposase/invertase (TIGR01784 family)